MQNQALIFVNAFFGDKTYKQKSPPDLRGPFRVTNML
jgi:hypothetical protein